VSALQICTAGEAWLEAGECVFRWWILRTLGPAAAQDGVKKGLLVLLVSPRRAAEHMQAQSRSTRSSEAGPPRRRSQTQPAAPPGRWTASSTAAAGGDPAGDGWQMLRQQAIHVSGVVTARGLWRRSRVEIASGSCYGVWEMRSGRVCFAPSRPRLNAPCQRSLGPARFNAVCLKRN